MVIVIKTYHLVLVPSINWSLIFAKTIAKWHLFLCSEYIPIISVNKRLLFMWPLYCQVGELLWNKVCWVCDRGWEKKFSYVNILCSIQYFYVASLDLLLNPVTSELLTSVFLYLWPNFRGLLLTHHCFYSLCHTLGISWSAFTTHHPHTSRTVVRGGWQPPVNEFSTTLSEKEENKCFCVSVCVMDSSVLQVPNIFSQMLQLRASSIEVGFLYTCCWWLSECMCGMQLTPMSLSSTSLSHVWFWGVIGNLDTSVRF